MLTALKILASDPGLTAITLAELDAHNAASDPGLLEHSHVLDYLTPPA